MTLLLEFSRYQGFSQKQEIMGRVSLTAYYPIA